MQPLKDLACGIIRHPWKTAGYVFTAFSVLFTLIKGSNQFFPAVKIEGPFAFGIIVLVSVIFGFGKVWRPSKIEIKVANTDTVLEIFFGDLFATDGYRAIAVNEFFDSELGKVVDEHSVHGQLLKRGYGGHPESFDKQVREELKAVPAIQVPRPSGKPLRYELGTTALLTVNDDRYLAFVLTETDVMTCKASADVNMLWQSLACLWKRARLETGGTPLNVPLVGSGLASLGMPTRDLLNLIVLSIIVGSKTQITRRIRIVLWHDRYDELDLREVKKFWEEY